MGRDTWTARAIAEDLLSKSGKGLMEGDFQLFLSCFYLPQTVATFDGSTELTKEADVRQIYDQVRTHFDRVGVTDLVRRCVEAGFRADGTIGSTHETRLMRGTTILEEPYPVFSVIQQTDKGWQVSYSSYALPSTNDHSRALRAMLRNVKDQD